MEEKLITLENLSTFLDNLINDSSISNKTTWSSQKISEALASLEERITTLENG